MKKILAVAIVLVMLVAMVACEASKGDLTSINDYVAPNYTYVTETGTFTFAEAGGNTAVITGYVGKAEPHAVVIPAEVTVASLEENAKNDDNVREIVGIADNAFYYCTAMTSVTVPNTIQTIGKWAFAGCTGLSEIVLP
ncbi:MAG: leucine-rich repeat protein, partial [Clostridia bacterium]|nr:leucine-rich repeat protein [Clostridia bacterium]